MWIKILSASILAMMLMGAGCSSNTTTRTVTPTAIPEPEPETVIVYQPAPEPDEPIGADHPTVGTGSVKYTPTCEASFAKVKYVYEEDSTIDNTSFVIVHSADGVQTDIHTAAGNHNGAVMIMEDNVLIPKNETTEPIAHQIEIEFISAGHAQVNSFAFIQPECSVEPTPEPDVPTPDPEPTSEYHPYVAHHDYIIGDLMSIVDDTGITRFYVCIIAYRSGDDGDWDDFEDESDNWSRVNKKAALNLVTKIR
jgi:hypothetical protein